MYVLLEHLQLPPSNFDHRAGGIHASRRFAARQQAQVGRWPDEVVDTVSHCSNTSVRAPRSDEELFTKQLTSLPSRCLYVATLLVHDVVVMLFFMMASSVTLSSMMHMSAHSETKCMTTRMGMSRVRYVHNSCGVSR